MPQNVTPYMQPSCLRITAIMCIMDTEDSEELHIVAHKEKAISRVKNLL